MISHGEYRMADVFSPTKRSEVMSRIRGKGNEATEITLISLLREHQLTGWRRHQLVFGRPDFVFRRQRVAVFVDGCFWHGCPRHFKMPRGNRAFWTRKMANNRARDRLVNRTLRADGWRVIRIWEHSLTGSMVAATLHRLKSALSQSVNRRRAR